MENRPVEQRRKINGHKDTTTYVIGMDVIKMGARLDSDSLISTSMAYFFPRSEALDFVITDRPAAC